jgi:regulator of sigma E protease
MEFSVSSVSRNIYDIYQYLYAHDFLYGLAIYSIVLFFINILPIYPLDGGRAVIESYEIVTGKRPSDRLMTALAWIGSILFIILFWILPMF